MNRQGYREVRGYLRTEVEVVKRTRRWKNRDRDNRSPTKGNVVISLLRRLLGPDPAILAEQERLRGEVAAARYALMHEAERHAIAVAERDEQVAQAKRYEAGAQRALSQALEPGAVDDCQKVRLRDRDEAQAYARQVEADTGRESGALDGYPCKRCPRQPVTSARFWHVFNVDPAMRTNRGLAQPIRQDRARAARREGRTIGQRIGVDPS